jgi:hypothetical protein
MPFEELKERHAIVWGAGPYQGIMETITDIHTEVIDRLRLEPPGVGNQFDRGREDYVRGLLDDHFELEFEELDSPLEMDSGEGVGELWVRDYGPTKVLAGSLDDDKREELHRNFVELHERSRVNGGLRVSRTYLLTLGRRR